MRIFIICPVRGISEEERNVLSRYVADLEKAGHIVHWPPRDTNQNDPRGLRIVTDNFRAIEAADEIHIWWNGKSQGSLADFHMAFALRKKVVLINPDAVQKLIEEENLRGITKSYNKVVWDYTSSA